LRAVVAVGWLQVVGDCESESVLGSLRYFDTYRYTVDKISNPQHEDDKFCKKVKLKNLGMNLS
jgi:hypothetical protein